MKALKANINKAKALVAALSGHCETSRRSVDSSNVQCYILTFVDVSVHVVLGPDPGLHHPQQVHAARPQPRAAQVPEPQRGAEQYMVMIKAVNDMIFRESLHNI